MDVLRIWNLSKPAALQSYTWLYVSVMEEKCDKSAHLKNTFLKKGN